MEISEDVSQLRKTMHKSKLLFVVSTTVTLGDRRKAKFWHPSRWHMSKGIKTSVKVLVGCSPERPWVVAV
jgi:hypothetical protein